MEDVPHIARPENSVAMILCRLPNQKRFDASMRQELRMEDVQQITRPENSEAMILCRVPNQIDLVPP